VQNHLGLQTLTFSKQPRFEGSYSLVGPMEGRGPLGSDFNEILPDDNLGQKTPEKTERLMLEKAILKLMEEANLKPQDFQFFIAGDLLNQIVTSSFNAATLALPFLGIYAACATFGAALGLGALLIQGDFAQKVLIGTASHYQTAERQFRYPIELNIQHRATNHHTVTGAAAAALGLAGAGPRLTDATFGIVVDKGLKDVNDMGSAMAPAAFATLKQHLADTGRGMEDYDIVLTGDLGRQGSKMLKLLAEKQNMSGLERLQDGGAMIYDSKQNAGTGGSGAACVAVTTLGYLLNQLAAGRAKRALVIATGALFSPITALQGETIPTIAHAIALEA